MSKESIAPQDEFITQFSEAFLKHKRVAELRSYVQGRSDGWCDAVEELLEAGLELEFLAQKFNMSIEQVEEKIRNRFW